VLYLFIYVAIADCLRMRYVCEFCHDAGLVPVISSRQAFRRHLSVRHGADFRRQRDPDGQFRDHIVTLTATELEPRLNSLRRGRDTALTKVFCVLRRS
jgi:hypothetical protein